MNKRSAAALVLMLGTGPCGDAFALAYVCSGTQQSFTNTDPAGTTTGTIQSLVVTTNSVTIDAAGAAGGPAGSQPGGQGAEVVTTATVIPGTTLCVLVGVEGNQGADGIGAGGGASYVYSISSGTCLAALPSITPTSNPQLLVAAAGGGGATLNEAFATSQNGVAPTGAGVAGASDGVGTPGDPGGTGGNGGSAVVNSGGDGGLLTDGVSTNGVSGGFALIHGASGGSYENGNATHGGFGGGGAAVSPGGGGGGYNGGSAGNHDFIFLYAGGGGGSFSAFAPLAPYTQSGVQSGNGAVNICLNATTPVRFQSFSVD